MSEQLHSPAGNQVDSHYEPGTDQDLDAGAIWYTLIVGTIVTIIVIYLLKAMFYKADRDEIALKTYGVRYAELEDLRATQEQQLSRFEWRDSKLGLVTMPIELAMQRTVREYAAGRTDPPMPPAAAPIPPSAETSAAASAATASGGAGQPSEEHAAPTEEAEAH